MLQELGDVTGAADCDNDVNMPQDDMRYPDAPRAPKTKENKDNEETSSRCKRKTELVSSTSRNSTAVWGRLRALQNINEENLKAGYHTLTQYLCKK